MILINLKIDKHNILINYRCIIFFILHVNNKDEFDNLHIKFAQT